MVTGDNAFAATGLKLSEVTRQGQLSALLTVDSLVSWLLGLGKSA
jgi:hypothetical protein